LLAADRIRALKSQAKRQDLVVLVWGPGDPGSGASPEASLYWEKRNQIRDCIAKEFSSAEVYFSESEALREHTRDLENLLTEELVHAAIADCILVLDVSRGSHVEIDRFSTIPAIAKKIRVLLPERHTGSRGLVSQILNGLKVIGFTEEELSKCNVATKICVDIVLSVALEKLMAFGGLAPL
jgi:hypothetical protein